MTLNEYQHQALSDLIALKKIDILESLGHDAIPDVGIIYEMNLEKLESKISAAILEGNEMALGSIMMQLFMDYNADIINEKAQEFQSEAMQDKDDLNGKMSVSELARKHYENGVSPGDFF